VQARVDTARPELEQMKAEIAYRVAHAQLVALVGAPPGMVLPRDIPAGHILGAVTFGQLAGSSSAA
jgi:hypothetical protein